MNPRYTPTELACALGLFPPTDEQAAVIAAPPGPLVVIAGAGAGKTETMAARVVWLIANGYAEPGQVLGLTFTRKAAGQLLRRVRSRLARLAGVGLGAAPEPEGAPVVSTYHAFAGSLLRDHGLLLPVEPDTRLLGETELWQLAFDVVSGYRGELRTDKTPAAVTSMVLRLWGQLAEHLVDTGQLRDTHVELERLIHALPAGPHQRDRGPGQWLLRLLAAQTERTELVPLLDALHERMRAVKAMDFGMQMASAARLAVAFPRVGEELRNRFRVVLLDEYQDTGHAQRIALSALFGGGVDDGLALTAVGDPIQSIYGWRGASATNLPRFTTDFPRADGTPAPVLELRTSWRNPPRVLRVANAISAEARRRSVAVHALRSRPDAPPGAVRCALLADVAAEREWIADQLQERYRQAHAGGVSPPTAAVLVRRNADAAPVADALRARGIPVEVVGLAGLLSVPEVADLVAMLRLVADPTAGAAAMRVLTGPRWRLGGRDLAGLQHAQVPAGAARGPEAGLDVGALPVEGELEAGPAWLRHLEDGRAPGPHVADARIGFERADGADVLAECGGAELHVELGAPGVEVLRRIGVDRLVDTSVHTEVGLPIAGEVELRQPQDGGPSDRALANAAPHVHASDRGENGWRTYVDRGDLDHGACPILEPTRPAGRRTPAAYPPRSTSRRVVSWPEPETPTRTDQDAVLRSHRWRTAENSAAYLLPFLRAGDRLLDVGCGPGTITVDLARVVAPAEVVGIDVADSVVAEAVAHAKQAGVSNVSFRTGDFRAAGFGVGTFDVVHAHQVLQHLRDPVGALTDMAALVRPGGIVAARDSDYPGFIWAPGNAGLERWREVYLAVARRNGAEPEAGRSLLAWAHAAGLADVAYGSSTWAYVTPGERRWWSELWAERCVASSFAHQAVEYEIATPSELRALAEAWRAWAGEPDAVFVVLHGEILART